ncbi:MAG: VWA domain-containing protein [Planctomycetes bacterium]|nr:VWA domain-containing protein [Planctomycetota bacterium]
MALNFLNPWMLLGLLGLSLPILAHLLSKKRFDVVHWGAMQFLELGRNARRKIRLEQFLLMLLRMGLIALIALALARPWAKGGWVSDFTSKQNRDVVFIIDGSYSMGWKGQQVTPHKAAVTFARKFLKELRPGDTFSLIDARDQVRVVIDPPTSDFDRVRKELNKLPPPSGTSDLAEATRKALQILSKTSNISREIIVITDGQAKGWKADDAGLWDIYDTLLDEPSVRPRTWVVETADLSKGNRTNFSLDRLQLSRELTSVGFPLRISTKLRYSGGKDKDAVTLNVYLEIDGQRKNVKTRKVLVQPDGESPVEFEYQLSTPGSHLISVVLDDKRDKLPGDNRAEAAIVVTQEVPVLLVDGDPRPGDALIESETAFALSALTPAARLGPNDKSKPLVKADVVPYFKLKDNLEKLQNYQAVFLANVPKFTAEEIAALTKYLENGGGVFFTLGDKVNAQHYNAQLYKKGSGILPALLVSIEENEDASKQTVHADNDSLKAPWLQLFRSESKHYGDFVDARYSHRWRVKPFSSKSAAEKKGVKKPPQKAAQKKTKSKKSGLELEDPVVVAKLNTGDPLLITRKYGLGKVVLMTTPLDAAWGTLQSKKAFTALLQEIVVYLATARFSRNVTVGSPLVLAIDKDADPADYKFFGPGKTEFAAVSGGISNGRKIIQLNDTHLPGLYKFQKLISKGDNKGDADTSVRPGYFIVNFDRSESNLAPLKKKERENLIKSATAKDSDPVRMTFLRTQKELKQGMFAAAGAEFWEFLMLVFLAILVFEVVMTRRMVQGGHALVDEDSPANSAQEAPPPLPPGSSQAGREDDDLPEIVPVGTGGV